MPIGDFRCPHCKRWVCTFHAGHGCAAAGAMGPTAIVRSNRHGLPNEVEIPHPYSGGVVRTESITQTFINTLPIQDCASPDFVIIDDPCDDIEWVAGGTYYQFGHTTISDVMNIGWDVFTIDEHAQSIVDEYTSQYRQKGICRRLVDTGPISKD